MPVIEAPGICYSLENLQKISKVYKINKPYSKCLLPFPLGCVILRKIKGWAIVSLLLCICSSRQLTKNVVLCLPLWREEGEG